MDFHKPRYIPMSRRRRIYEGKAKVLYEGPEPGTLIQHFKDDATAFNAKKHEVIEGKGVLNNRISEYVFQHLNEIGVPTHFIRRLNMREQLIREVEIIPLEVVVRNVAAGSLVDSGSASRRARSCRARSSSSITRTTQLNDPMVSEEHITAFGWATPQEIDDIMALAIRVNDFLSGLFLGVGIRLVDFKMEMRPAVGKRHDADRGGGRDLARFVPAVGHQVEREARQGPLPPRPRRPARGLHRGRQAPRHHERGRAPAGHRPGAGEGVGRAGSRHGRSAIDTGPMTVEDFFAFTDARPDEEKWELIDGEPVLNATPSYVHQRIVGNITVPACRRESQQRRTLGGHSGHRRAGIGYQPSRPGRDHSSKGPRHTEIR